MSVDNNIPKDWVETTLGEVCEVQSGGTPSTKNNTFWNGDIGWITPKDLSNYKKVFIKKGKRSITQIGLNKSSAKLLPKHTILFSSRAPIGYVVIAENEISTNQGFKNLICDEENSHYKYFYYLLKLKANHIEKLSSGSTFSEASASLMKSIELTIPKNTDEQKAIAQILTSFDDKIELLQAQNKTLETTAQTIFKEWFGKESDDWEFVKIDDYLDISSSKRIFHSEYVDNGIPFYRSKEIIELSTKPDISTELFISKERFEEIKGKFDIPKKGDILLTAVGTLGVPLQVRDNKPFYFKDGNLMWFKNFKNTISSDFVYNWLKLESTQHQLNMISIGSTQKALTIKNVRELKIPNIKNLEKRKNLNEFLKSNLNKVNHNYAQIQTLKKTRDTLLPKLMSGVLRVSKYGQLRVDEFKK